MVFVNSVLKLVALAHTNKLIMCNMSKCEQFRNYGELDISDLFSCAKVTVPVLALSSQTPCIIDSVCRI